MAVLIARSFWWNTKHPNARTPRPARHHAHVNTHKSSVHVKLDNVPNQETHHDLNRSEIECMFHSLGLNHAPANHCWMSEHCSPYVLKVTWSLVFLDTEIIAKCIENNQGSKKIICSAVTAVPVVQIYTCPANISTDCAKMNNDPMQLTGPKLSHTISGTFLLLSPDNVCNGLFKWAKEKSHLVQ